MSHMCLAVGGLGRSGSGMGWDGGDIVGRAAGGPRGVVGEDRVRSSLLRARARPAVAEEEYIT